MKKEKTNWDKIKKLFTDIHLWLGLTGGIVIFVICLTGTIYTFSPEIQEILQPELYQVKANSSQEKLSADELVTIVEGETGSKAVSIIIPEDRNRLYSIAVQNETGKGRPETYQVDPYTGELMGISGKGKGSEFFFTVFKLHRWLLMDQSIGRPIVGMATILFAFGCLSGIVIWFPRKIKHWKQGLKIKMKGNWKRTNHDLHNTLGFYSVVFLLIMALTGLCWSFVWYKDGLSSVLGAEVFAGRNQEEIKSPQTNNAAPLNASELLAIGQNAIRYKGDLRISFPKSEDGAVIFTKSKNGFFASAAQDKIQINRFSGEVVDADLFANKSIGQKIAASVKPLHLGTIFGTFSKIIYFICCLIATSLPVTGTLIWWNKLKKKRTKRKKAEFPQQKSTASRKRVEKKELDLVGVESNL